MSRFWEIVFFLSLLFRRHVCLSELKHSPSRELPLTARKTVFSHLKASCLKGTNCWSDSSRAASMIDLGPGWGSTSSGTAGTVFTEYLGSSCMEGIRGIAWFGSTADLGSSRRNDTSGMSCSDSAASMTAGTNGSWSKSGSLPRPPPPTKRQPRAILSEESENFTEKHPPAWSFSTDILEILMQIFTKGLPL